MTSERDPTVNWELVEDLHDRYMVGLSEKDHDKWFEEYHGLSEDEQEVLKWKIEEGDSGVQLFIQEMTAQGADSIAELKDEPS